jgi:hypothetical protein
VQPIGVSFTGVRPIDRESYMLESRSAANRGEFYSGAANTVDKESYMLESRSAANRGEFYRSVESYMLESRSVANRGEFYRGCNQ